MEKELIYLGNERVKVWPNTKFLATNADGVVCGFYEKPTFNGTEWKAGDVEGVPYKVANVVPESSLVKYVGTKRFLVFNDTVVRL